MDNLKKLRILLWFVVLYTITVFTWWTFSLLTLNKDNYKAAIRELKLETEIVKSKTFYITIEGRFKEGGEPLICQTHKVSVNLDLLHDYLHESYGDKFEYIISKEDGISILEQRLDIIPSNKEIAKLEYKRDSRKRAFLSEVIFFLILLLSAMMWLYSKLQVIIRSNMQQNNFLLAITHELKTPLATVLLSLDTIKRKISKQKYNIEEFVEMGVQGIDRFQVLLDDILLTTRLEGTTYKYNLEPVEIDGLIEEEVERFKNSNGLSSEVKVDLQQNCIALADTKTLKIVLSNLLSNALKYSKNSVTIEISCRTVKNNVEIVVSDKGIGIPDSEKKNIFKRFYRLGDENTRETTGTGLGLNIVKRIIAKHKGKIVVKDNQPTGTKFVLKLKNYG